VFICPSDGTETTSWGEPMLNNYHGSMGTTTDIWNQSSTGMFAHRLSIKESSVKDGLSNTILFSEALVGSDTVGSKWRDSVTGTTGANASLLNPVVAVAGQLQLAPAVQTALQECTVAYQGAGPHTWNRGWRWGPGSPGLTLFNTVVTPNSQQYQWSGCRFGCPGCGVDFGNFLNSNSGHPGGVNVGMADGSVRFVKDTISQRTWVLLQSANDGQVAGDDC
jgi:prepilin-type processing-associated H-X9-DG protein